MITTDNFANFLISPNYFEKKKSMQSVPVSRQNKYPLLNISWSLLAYNYLVADSTERSLEAANWNRSPEEPRPLLRKGIPKH